MYVGPAAAARYVAQLQLLLQSLLQRHAHPPPTRGTPPTQVDIKLKAFDQKNKIKVIKEVRGVTNLGLKEVRAPRRLPRPPRARPPTHPPPHPHIRMHPAGQGAGGGRAVHHPAKGEEGGRRQDDREAEGGVRRRV